MDPDLLVRLIPGAAGVAALSTLVSFILERLSGRAKPRERTLQDELDSTLSALKRNSDQAGSLLAALQGEVGKRTATVQRLEDELHALRQQRSLLELTPEQRDAIAAMVRRPATPREIFRSTDFWLGRVLPGFVFFALGLAARGFLG